ncbi:Ig-like domain-containing protein [Shewanella youngdeokensis]|uniref:Ig-like domain-containing protein n=1 Tax=Shewanella youngdeokensis TaxID=2999068 RepID=A0ABZ0JX39_9GAMM|nr:Ig-like domain-containing protein [Shewanella sp. DAU334]
MKSIAITQTGHIQKITGTVTADIDGNVKQVLEGDLIPAGTNLSIEDNSYVELIFEDGSIISSSDAPTVTAEVLPPLDSETLSEIEEIQALIAAGEDPTEGPDTAAGSQVSSNGSAAPVSIARGGAETLAEAGYDSAGQNISTAENTIASTQNDDINVTNSVAFTSITEDTGSSSSDFITNDNTLVFNGSVDLDDDSTLVVNINGTDYTTSNGLVIDAQGNWSVDLTGTTLADGTYPVTATVTDLAGNSDKATQDVVVDTKIDEDEDGQTVAITSITDDTGSSATDFITNDNTLVFKGTVDLDDDSTLVVNINGTDYTTSNGLVIDAQGNWSVDLTGTTLADGTYPVTATVTDLAGNSDTATQDVVVDTKIDEDEDGQTVAITSITDDTGSSATDFITNDNSLVFNGSVDLDDDSTLVVNINGTDYTTSNGLVIDAQGNWSVDLTGTTLADGTYPVTATVTDVAGNSDTATQDVVVDTKIDEDEDGQTVAITSITDDTGSSATDFITNDNSLVFNGSVDLDDDSTLVVNINGTDYTTSNGLVIDAQGNWSVDLTGTTLADGTYPVTATVTDLAGNSDTATQDVVVDTKIDEDEDGQTVAITSITDDTGSSATDFITNDNTLVFNGSVDLDDDSTLVVNINGTDYTTSNGLVIDAQGNWSVDLTGTTLADGTYPVTATVTDLAGNSDTATQDVVVDTKIDEDEDGQTVAITSITDDTGSSAADFITNDNTLVFNGSVDLDDDSTLVVNINGTDYTTSNGLVIDAQGNWSVDLTGTTLADGTYPVTATVTDVAGNSDKATQDVVVDTKIDEDEDGQTVAITSITDDTGSSATDFITNDNTLVFKGTVDLGDDSTLVVNINGTDYTTDNGLVIDAQGNWSVDLTGTTLADGTYPVTATVTDVAGNSDKATQDVVVDTKIDEDEDGQTVAITSITDDTGSSATDFITNDNTLVFKGTVDLGDDSTLVVNINGTDYTAANGLVIDALGNWSVDLTGTTLADGTYPVTATVTDLAGNSDKATQNVVVDTTAPNAPTVTIVDDNNPDDTQLTNAEINGDGVQLTVAINADDFAAGGSVNLTINNGNDTSTVELVLVGDQLQFDDGSPATNYNYSNGTISWTETTPADGETIKVEATQTDKAGNTSAPGSDNATVGDTTAPNAPTVTIVDDNNPDDTQLTNAEINGDGVQLTVAINADDFAAGGSVNLTIYNGNDTSTVELVLVGDQLQFDDGSPATNYNYSNGTISWTETTPADGETIKVEATQTDKAGNTSAPGSDNATVGDTTAPNAPTVTIVDDNNPDDTQLTNAEINGDGVQLTVAINADDFAAGGSVNLTIYNGNDTSTVELVLVGDQLQFDDGSPATNYNYSNGTISWTETTPADGETIKVEATQTDKAGNTSAPGSDNATVGDTTAPNAPTVTIVDDNNPDDTQLTNAEINGDGVQLTVAINADDFAAGGSVNLTINNGNDTSTVELVLVGDQLQFDDGSPATNYNYSNGTISWTETTPADGETIKVEATQTDKAGNTSAPGSDNATVGDTTAPNAPTVTIVDDNNPDDTQLTNAEINGDGVQLTVAINADDFAAGGSVNLTIYNGNDTSTVELVLVGDQLQFDDGSPATNYNYSNGTISWTETTPADGETIKVEATQTDKAGNTSAPGSDNATVGDTTAPNAPTVTIVDDNNPDDTQLTNAEINGDGVQLTVAINADDFAAGGSVNLTINNGNDTSTVELVLVGDQLQFDDGSPATNYNYSNGTISWTETTPADGETIKVEATQTDKAGNTSAPGSDNATVGDTTAPNAPTVTIVDDNNPDDTQLTNAEINGDGVQLTVAINADDFAAGGSVNLTIYNGNDTSTVELVLVGDQLQFDDGSPATNYNYSNGTISWTETTPADGETIKVEATQTDKAGNTSAPGSDNATVGDTTAPNAPTVTIVDDNNPDDTQLTNAEINGDGVQLTVAINADDFAAGGSVNLTIYNGNDTSTVELVLVGDQLQFDDGSPATNYNYSNGTISWTETTPADGETIKVEATQTDKAGNTSAPGSDNATVGDTTAPNAPTVTIVDDNNPDDTQLTNAEINGDGVQLTVAINADDFAAGGSVNLTINNGNDTSTVELVLVGDQLQFDDGSPATNYNYSNGTISWTETTPADGETIKVEATQTDKAGNTSAPGSDNATVGDTTAPNAPTVTIVDDNNPDDTQLTNAEINGDGVQLTVAINADDFAAGGSVNLTINNGNDTSTVELVLVGDQLQFDDGSPATNYNYSNGTISWTETTPADGETIKVEATQTDKAGNTSAPGSDNATVGDTTAPNAPTVTIVDDNNPDDTQLTNAEINGDGVQLTVAINADDFAAGGSVNLTIYNGNDTSTVELVLVGDQLQFDDGSPATNYNYSNGTISWTETTPADGETIKVEATQTDKAGNTSAPGSDNATVGDTTAPNAPTVTIVDDNNPDDTQLTNAEINGDGVQLTVAINADDFAAGGSVNLTIYNGNNTSTVELVLVGDQLQFDDGSPATNYNYSNGTISWTETTPADGETIKVEATQTDKAGNTSAPGSDNATVGDTTAPNAPTVTIVDDNNPDDTQLTNAEINGDGVQLTVAINADDFAAGGSVNLTINNGNDTSTVELVLVGDQLQFDDGSPATNYNYSNGTISWTETTPADGETIKVEATQTDKAGNTSAPGSDNATVGDTTAPNAPTVTIVDDNNPDDTQLTNAEINGDGVQLTVAINADDFAAGGSVNLTIYNGNNTSTVELVLVGDQLQFDDGSPATNYNYSNGTISWTETTPADGETIKVEATQTDKAGNTSAPGSDNATVGDTTAPNAPTVTIVDDNNPDDTQLTNAEINGDGVQLTVAINADDFAAGGSVNLTINNGNDTSTVELVLVGDQLQFDDGSPATNYNYSNGTISWTETTPADGETIKVEATQTDKAGNTSAPGSDNATVGDTTAPNAPTVTIVDDNNPDDTQLTNAEINGDGVQLTVAINADDFAAGGSVNLTIYNGNDTSTVELVLVGDQLQFDDGSPATNYNYSNGTISWTETTPADGETIKVEATQTDKAGNTSAPGSDNATVGDTTAPNAPTVTIVDDNNPDDTQLTNAEINGDGVQLTVAINADDFAAGGSVNLTIYNGNDTSTVELVLVGDQLQFDDGSPATNYNYSNGTISWTETTPADGETIKVEATQTDKAGNTSAPGSDNATVGDTTAPNAPTVTIVDDNNPDDTQLTNAEINGDGVQLTVAINADDFAAGGSVNLTINNGNNTSTVELVLVGDQLQFDDGSPATNYNYSNGTISWTETTPADGETIKVEATQTDKAGNTSAPGSDNATVGDTTAPNAPTVTIVDDNNPDDTQLTNAEINGDGVQLTVAINADDFAAGGSVNLTINNGNNTSTVELVLVGDQLQFDDGSPATNYNYSNGTISWTETTPADGETIKVEATQTDEAGNTSAPGSDNATVGDTTAPNAPTVTIVDDNNPDDTQLTNAEINGDGVQLTVAINADDFAAGGSVNLTIYNGNDTSTVELVLVGDQLQFDDGSPATNYNYSNGTISWTETTPADGETIKVEATQTDKAGNTSAPGSDNATVGDTTAPNAPTVTIVDDNNPDDTQLTNAEINGDGVQLTVAINADDFAAGGSVNLTINNGNDTSTVELVLVGDQLQFDDGSPATNYNYSNGTISWTETTPADGETIKVEATQTDKAGNTSAPGSDNATVGDTTAPNAPTVTIVDDNNPDDTQLTNAEINGDGVQLTVAINADDFAAGGSVNLTIYNGNNTSTVELVLVGDQLQFDDGSPATNYNYSNGTISWTETTPADGETIKVEATQTDKAGNTSAPGSDNATVGDTTAPNAPTVTIVDDNNPDDTQLTNAEINGDGVQLTVAINADDFAAGGSVNLTIYNGNNTSTVELVLVGDQLQFDDGSPATNYNYSNGTISWTETTPADGETIKVEATQTDKAGNTSAPGSDNATVGDTTAPNAPTVTIVDDNNPDDTQLTNAEINGDGVQLTVAINADDFAAGGSVNLTINNGNNTSTVELVLVGDQLQFDDGSPATNYNYSNGTISWTETTPADGETIKVEATQTDKAGNTSAPGSDNATVGDTTAPNAPTVTIVDDNNPDDTQLTNAEINGDGVQLTVAINADDFAAGGSVNLTIYNGNDTSTVELVLVGDQLQFDDGSPATNYNYSNGTISWTETTPADGETIKVEATQTDKAGNTSAPGSDNATVGDTTAPNAPTVTIVDDNNPDDTQLTNAEINGDGVQLTVAINADDFAAGGSVNLTIYNGNDTSTVELVLVGDQLQFDDGSPATNYNYSNGTISWTETTPADGETIKVEATQTDKAGNTSAPGSDNATVGDTTAPNAPTVTIVDDNNPDDTQLTNAEINGDGVQLTVAINADDFAAGGSVNLTINNGNNTSTVELVLVGDQLQFDDGSPATNYNYSNGTISWTETTPADGETIKVEATQTDKAGNTSAPGSDNATVGDTTAPNAPTVTIVDDNNPDDTQLTNAEINGDGVQLTVAINADDFAAGGSVNLTINNGNDTSTVELVLVGDQLQFDDGSPATNYNYSNGTISWTETTPADGETIKVEATQTDEAGNTSAPGSDNATVGDTTAPNAPTVTIVDDNNPDDTQLTNAEINGDGVQLTVAINADDFAAGGSVNLTIYNGNDTSTVELVLVGDQLQFDDGSPATNYNYSNGTISWTETTPADGETIKVEATQTDKAGNTSAPGSDNATVGDTTAPNAPTVTIVDDNNPDDTQLTNAEINGDGVQLTVAINADDFAAGGSVNLTINNGNNTSTVELVLVGDQLQFDDGSPATNYNYSNGTISWTETTPADGETIKVEATQTDKAGNTSAPGSDNATVGDTTAPNAPTVTIVDDNNPDDTQLTNAEINGDGVQLTVAINADDFAAGGSVNLTINNGNDTSTVELVLVGDQLQFDDGSPATNYNYSNGTISWTETTPADGETIKVEATQTDKAGNTSAPGSDNATVGDTTAPDAPVVVIVDDSNDNQVLTEAEIGNDEVQVEVTINSNDFAANGTVQLTINNGPTVTALTLSLGLNGSLIVLDGQNNPVTGFSYDDTTGVISWTETTPANEQELVVKATQTDDLGNQSPTGQDNAMVRNNTETSLGEAVEGTNDTVLAIPNGLTFEGTTALGGSVTLVNGNYIYTAPVRDHSDNESDQDSFSVTNADGTISKFTIEITDTVPEAKDDNNSVDVFDSFLVGGVEAVWTASEGGASVITFDGFNGVANNDGNNYDGGDVDNDTGHDQIRWGSSGNSNQSGYGFIDNDQALDGKIALNQDITLGTFTHYNYSIGSDTAISSAVMTITFTVKDAQGVETPVTLDIPFTHNETPNNGANPEDIITIGEATVTFEYQGNDYNVQVVGFREVGQPDGNVVTEISTAEGQSTSYDVVVKIVETDEYSLPSTEGNVLTNDVMSEDIDIVVVEVETEAVTDASATIITGEYGKLTIESNGQYTYQVTEAAVDIPDNATETFEYTIRDSDGNESTAQLTINVNIVEPTNEPTITQNDFLTVDEDSSQSTGNVLTDAATGDSDPDNVLSVTLFSVEGKSYDASSTVINLSEGSFSLDTDGNYTFTPTENWSGTVPTVTYTTNTNATADLVITVNAKADAPLISLNESETLAFMDFEDVNFERGAEWNSNVDIGSISGANTIGDWGTNNDSGHVEVGYERIYLPGESSNKVLEIEADAGDKTLFVDIDCEAGRFYQVGFDIAARLEQIDSSGMTIKIVQINENGNEIGTVEDLYTFDPDSNEWQLNQTVNLQIDTSGTYRLIFESQNADSRGALIDNLSFKAVENYGYEDSFVKLSEINTSLTDADYSEQLSVTLSGIPEGSTLKGTLTNGGPISAIIGTDPVSLDGWDLSTLQVLVADSGTYNVIVTATSTETSNADTSSSTINFDLVIEEDPSVIINGVAPFVAPEVKIEVQANEPVIKQLSVNAIDENDETNNVEMIGTIGNDMMIAGLGVDTFIWNSDSVDGSENTDRISDFNLEQDKLDLTDILQGDSIDELSQYINFTNEDGSTVINVDTNQNGEFDQHIVLDGVDLSAQYGIDSEAIINGLLGNSGDGPLLVGNNQDETLIIDSSDQLPLELDNNGVLNAL